MPLLTWDHKYSVNNFELDIHHKKLFDIFNKLYNSCLDKGNGLILGPIVDELVVYTNYHFAAEEQYMRSVGYKDINQHISEHKIFTESISQQLHKTDVNDSAVSKQLVLFIWNCLLNHIIKEDKKYSIKSNRKVLNGNIN
jgi:hemerythrin-like metal-binding protein